VKCWRGFTSGCSQKVLQEIQIHLLCGKRKNWNTAWFFTYIVAVWMSI